MTMTNDLSPLRFLQPQQTQIAGAHCAGMTVRAAAGVIGELEGFVVEPLTRRLRYFVVRTTGLFGRTKLMPATAARIDMETRAIELLDEDIAESSQVFKPELFPAFSDEDLLAAVFSRQSAA